MLCDGLKFIKNNKIIVNFYKKKKQNLCGFENLKKIINQKIIIKRDNQMCQSSCKMHCTPSSGTCLACL